MARPLRIEIAGGFYHITSRGNERQNIFYSREDFKKFKRYLAQAKKKYKYILHCYVLMDNHYHLLLETPQANLSKIMHFINSSYSNYFNKKKERNGHLFQGRYQSILIDSDSYLLELGRYLHLNPVRAKIVKMPENYPHSSYKSYIMRNHHDIVYCSFILEQVAKEKNILDAKKIYKLFVEKAIKQEMDNPFQKVHAGMILGNENFISKTLSRIKNENLLKKEISYKNSLTLVLNAEDILHTICNYFQISMQDLIKNKKREYRKVAIFLIKKHTDLSNEQIGKIFGGISYSAIAKICQRFSNKLKQDFALRNMIEEIEIKMSNVKG